MRTKIVCSVQALSEASPEQSQATEPLCHEPQLSPYPLVPEAQWRWNHERCCAIDYSIGLSVSHGQRLMST
jgi:hypothetical protein